MTTPTDLKPGIRWGRVIVGGLLIEVLLIAVAVEMVSIVIVPATLIAAPLCGAWAARGTSRPVLNGTLTGAAALALFALMAAIGMLAAPDQVDLTTALSPAYLASHVFKVLGGTLGGWWVARRRAN